MYTYTYILLFIIIIYIIYIRQKYYYSVEGFETISTKVNTFFNKNKRKIINYISKKHYELKSLIKNKIHHYLN